MFERHEQPLITKVMLLTKQLIPSPKGGRELLCKLNKNILQQIYGDQLVLFELPEYQLHGMKSTFNAFRGHIDGLDKAAIAKALQTIHKENVTKVFVDGSNLGAIVAVLKSTFPQVEVTTFFHNVESRFFLGSFKQTKSLRSLAVLMVNYLAERKAVRYSDKIICLNERDSHLLKKVYGRGATHISPMALEDNMPSGFAEQSPVQSDKFALFVGGTFYANQAGIEWFVRHVVPNISIKVCIVGRGFESLRTELEIPGKVEVVGAVDSLAEWYQRAQFVIAPIFDGSGMKTKVAEALMFGKKIVGTPEAFTGYEDIAAQSGWVCSTVDEFVRAIKDANREVNVSFDPALRELYSENYSLPAAQERFKGIMK